MADNRVLSRMKKELERLKKDPPHGVTCWCKEGRLNSLGANLLGAEGTPYEGGLFKLEIDIPANYPFQPPHVQFVTKIYHPNIDTAGRICLDVLKSPPTGSWKPAHNLHTILTSIQLLLAEANPDDGLMADISNEYKQQRPTFNAKAKEWTRTHAMGTQQLETGRLQTTPVQPSDSQLPSGSSEGTRQPPGSSKEYEKSSRETEQPGPPKETKPDGTCESVNPVEAVPQQDVSGISRSKGSDQSKNSSSVGKSDVVTILDDDSTEKAKGREEPYEARGVTKLDQEKSCEAGLSQDMIQRGAWSGLDRGVVEPGQQVRGLKRNRDEEAVAETEHKRKNIVIEL
jgi:ubiquitin-conjugating enzyme E2 T